jgi:hypothetical protein
MGRAAFSTLPLPRDPAGEARLLQELESCSGGRSDPRFSLRPTPQGFALRLVFPWCSRGPAGLSMNGIPERPEVLNAWLRWEHAVLADRGWRTPAESDSSNRISLVRALVDCGVVSLEAALAAFPLEVLLAGDACSEGGILEVKPGEWGGTGQVLETIRTILGGRLEELDPDTPLRRGESALPLGEVVLDFVEKAGFAHFPMAPATAFLEWLEARPGVLEGLAARQKRAGQGFWTAFFVRQERLSNWQWREDDDAQPLDAPALARSDALFLRKVLGEPARYPALAAAFRARVEDLRRAEDRKDSYPALLLETLEKTLASVGLPGGPESALAFLAARRALDASPGEKSPDDWPDPCL